MSNSEHIWSVVNQKFVLSVVEASYIVNNQLGEPKLDYFCLPIKMGLTGFDSKCKDRARMQAGVCTALKDSYER